MAQVRAFFYTDPACPWSWADEPSVRRLEVEFEGSVEVRPVMAGLAREFGEPLALVREWLEACAASAMPADPRLWAQSPPRSSYPACMAVKAAAEQGRDAQWRFLRVLRLGLACHRRRLDHADALIDAARDVEALDVERLRIDLGSHAIVEAFGADLERAREAGARAGVDDRVPLPSWEFEGEDGTRHAVVGPQAYERLYEAASTAGARPQSEVTPSIEAALRRFGPLGTPEVAAACDLPPPRAAAELWRLAGEWRVRFERCLTGELWSLA